MTRGFAEKQQSAFDGVPVAGRASVNESDQLRAKLKIGPGGRVVVPAAMREALGVNEGDALMATLENGELRLVSLAESVRRAQAIVRSHVSSGVSLVDELLDDRRQEVLQERKGG